MAKVIKGELRGRPNRWVLDYRDPFGKRRWKIFRTKEQAEDALADVIRQSRQRGRPACDPDITVADYAERWVDRLAVRCKSRTVQIARSMLRVHLLPVFSRERVRRLSRGQIVDWLSRLSKSGLARGTVSLVLAHMRGLLNEAVEDGLLPSNPAARLGRRVGPPNASQEIKALTREQLSAFLEACRTHHDTYTRRLYPLFWVMARTGLRVGEALALRWEDLNLHGRSVRIERAFAGSGKHRRLETPKSGHGRRDVDLSLQTVAVLRKLRVKRAGECLRRGWGALPPWLFPNEAGQPTDDGKVRKVFSRVLKAAGLPQHFSPHSLRHTFASLLLQQGESPAYVQRQLGHASIKMTVDTYGRWLPMGNPAAVDGLDDTGGSPPTGEASDQQVQGALGAERGSVGDSTGSPTRLARRPVPVATGSQAVAAAEGSVVELRVRLGRGRSQRAQNTLILRSRAERSAGHRSSTRR